MEEIYTVSQAAKLLGVAPNTIRSYSKEFADHLSESATPLPGNERRFTHDDILIFSTVRALRSQRKDQLSIDATLARGERIELVSEGPESPLEQRIEPIDTDTVALAEKDILERFVMPLLESIQQQLVEERAARVEAEVEAARAAGQLEAIYRQSWYQFWKPKKPEG